MKKRLAIVVIIVVAVVATGRWACDTTIRDPQLVDHLVRDATWWFPDAGRPAIQRVHAAQTRSGRMGGRQEQLYAEFARPREFERFVAGATKKLSETDAERWKWELKRDVRLYGVPPSSDAPRWWPGPGRADIVLNVKDGPTLVAPAGSDRIVIWYFVP